MYTAPDADVAEGEEGGEENRLSSLELISSSSFSCLSTIAPSLNLVTSLFSFLLPAFSLKRQTPLPDVKPLTPPLVFSECLLFMRSHL